MNKLFTKIAGLVLGAVMAVGVGVAVASNSKEADPVYAASAQWQLVTSAPSDWSGEYILANGTSGTVKMMDGSSFSSSSCAGVDVTVSSSKITADTADALTIAKSSTNGKYTVKLNGKYIGKNANSNGIDANATWSKNLDNDITYSSNKVVIKGNGGRVLTWYASNSNFRYYAASNNNSQLYKKIESKTLSSISVSGATTSFTVGDSFSFGGTVTAHYSDSTTANVTSSATFSGYNMSIAGNQTVTASYTEGSTTKTATYDITVSAASTPTISLSASSLSGYTGQAFSVTATYSNLSSAFAWNESGAGTISGSITSTGTSTDGTSTYSGTLTGAGTKTLAATGGGATTQNYVITITKTTVSLNKNSTSIAQGRSETLTATSNAGSSFTWNSSNTSAATVDNGVVSVPAGATVGATTTITATSTVDTSVSATCTVTVTPKPLDTTYDFVTNFSSYNDGWTNSYGDHEGISGKTQLGGDYAATVDLYHASKQGSTITDRPVFASKTGSGSWTKVIGFTLNESGYKIKEVQVTFSQWGTKTPDVALFSGDEASGTPLDSGTIGTKNTISTSDLNGTTFTVGYCDKNTGSNVQSGLTSIYITLQQDNVLSSVSVSFDNDPADRTFNAGQNFAFNGTLTASYTVAADAEVTPTGYFLGGEEGTGDEITTSTILTVADHNGGEVYVQYEEGGVTKYDTFTLIVNAAPATSVTLSASLGSVALSPEIFEVSSITATVEPSAYAVQGVTWEVFDSDGLVLNSTYFFDGSEFRATQPADAVIFHVKANSNASIYATFTLTVTGDPIAHLLDNELVDVTDGSASVFADVGTLSYAVTTENFEGTMSYTWSTSNSAVISIDDDQGDICDFYVESLGGSARLSCRIQGSTKGDVTVYIDVTVTAVTVTSVSWSAPTINVYSGATLSSTSGWNVKYSTNSGKTDVTPDSFNILLGGSVITLPHEWSAADDGKALGVQVGGTNSSTVNVSVVQSLRPIMANETSKWDHTFTAKVWSAAGDWTISEKLWNMSGTDDGSPYFGYDATKGQQFGSGTHPFSDVSLQTSAFSGTIDSVTVYTSGANSINATVQVSVDGTAYGSAQTITNTNTAYTFDLGGESGTISIDWINSSSKAIYVKEIVVNTATGSHDIANAAGHEAAQRAVVAFAKAMNAAFASTASCTEGVADAWSTASAAYASNITNNTSLSADEKVYANNLIKHATAQYTDDTDEDYSYCLERAMATYETCIQKHGQTGFIDARPVSSSVRISPIGVVTSNGSTVAIVVITSMISLTAVGGYFFLRKRKEI